MRPRSSTFIDCHRDCESDVDQTASSRRRVSFDLSHNVVHILPTLEECRKEASRRGHEQWERKQLCQEILSDLIIDEIQQECARPTAEELDDGHHQQQHVPMLKSCLKHQQPPLGSSPPQSHHHKKHKKKGKRSTKRASKQHHGCNTEASRAQPLVPHANMAVC